MNANGDHAPLTTLTSPKGAHCILYSLSHFFVVTSTYIIDSFHLPQLKSVSSLRGNNPNHSFSTSVNIPMLSHGPTILQPFRVLSIEACLFFFSVIFLCSICYWHTALHASHSTNFSFLCYQNLTKSMHAYCLKISVGWEFPDLHKMFPLLRDLTEMQSGNLLGLASLTEVTG